MTKLKKKSLEGWTAIEDLTNLLTSFMDNGTLVIFNINKYKVIPMRRKVRITIEELPIKKRSLKCQKR